MSLNIQSARHVHAWTPTSGRYIFPGQLRVAENAYAQGVLKAAHGMPKKQHGLLFATLQVETARLDEPGAESIDVVGAMEGED